MGTTLSLYQIDAFTDTVFGGNPAAVCPLEAWLPDETLQNIASENNLSETAFFVPEGDGYHLRWFTPSTEVNLCGHATLSTAFVIFEFIDPDLDQVTFTSQSGELTVQKTADGLMMDFPAWSHEKQDAPDLIIDALSEKPDEFFHGEDIIAVFDSGEKIIALEPDLEKLAAYEPGRGLIITAPGKGEYDFISRCFYPKLKVPEDPVTGSAHCILTPYWAKRLDKNTLKARQASERGGDLLCELKGDRVQITGQAVLYMQGTINL